MAKKRPGKYADNIKAIKQGLAIANDHPLIRPLPGFELNTEDKALSLHASEWLNARSYAFKKHNFRTNTLDSVVGTTVWPNIRRQADPEEWAYVLARMDLHVTLNHLDPDEDSLPWHMACWFMAEQIISSAGIGRRPTEFPPLPEGLPRSDETALSAFLTGNEPPAALLALSLGKSGQPFWTCEKTAAIKTEQRNQRERALATGIRGAATAAVDVAGGVRQTLGSQRNVQTDNRKAMSWVISEYPLLAALASSFKLIEDELICRNMDIRVAAISDMTREIYFNPKVPLSMDEAKFVMAHELLHVGLRHSARQQGRDPWFWNVACDYVINNWLLEMQVGTPPDHLGYLHDPSLRGHSAEEVYDRIVGDLRWMRKLRKVRTFNGNKPDTLPGDHPVGWWKGGGTDLDAFYRRALQEGLELHLTSGRGLLPAGLIEEIRSLNQPPIEWDVALGQWLDQYFPPVESRRTFARASRRQSATPHIPRPARYKPEELSSSRVFGAVLDTSGSMSRVDLGKAVGAIASYAMSRDVGFVRLVYCDATAVDAGYLEPEVLLDNVKVTGRGGTVLMPGVRKLEEARDFPKNGPILIVTDGYCDTLTIRRDHAYLLADGGRLPFPPKGPVFRVA